MDEDHTAVRFVTSWATRPQDVEALREILMQEMQKRHKRQLASKWIKMLLGQGLLYDWQQAFLLGWLFSPFWFSSCI
ncbi:MAG TPA: hypothetical protein DCR31_07255 [Ruminococcaceae bacterium]|nr:hypothetical protein [Oscillospiraceae bacterium]